MLVAQVVEVVEVVEVLNGVRPNGHRSRLALRTRETDLAFASYMEGCGSNNSDYNVVCCNDHKMLAMHMSEAVNLKSRGSLKPGCALMHWLVGWLVGSSYSVSAANPQLCPAGRHGRQPTRCGR